jgi:hypothetical protein
MWQFMTKNDPSAFKGPFLFLISVTLGACGPAVPFNHGNPLSGTTAQTSAPLPTLIQSLNFKIVGEGSSSPSNPDLNWTSDSKRDRALGIKIVGESTFAFLRPLSSDGRALFFVWDDQAQGVPISSALFSYELQDFKNLRRTVLHPTPASRDAVQKIWFVPLTGLLEKLRADAYSYSSNDIHILKLDLVLGYARHELFEIQFRIDSRPATSFDESEDSDV